ncbi:unnamed protein product [marine sediment metagenome]|uniref:Uncharacterized protein n=1 Tax=marine sediment metagenome TaxID=412755 RepID=X1GR47_9ZZZZ
MTEPTWVKNFLNRLMAIQSDVIYDIPEEKRQEGYGRAAKMIIDGPQGGIFDLWFTESGVQEKPPEVPIKNTVYMTEDTLLNLITPEADLDTLVSLVDREGGIDKVIPQLYPRLDFRTALANQLITVSGDKPDVDSEEWAQIIERVLLKIAFPIVIRGILRKRREK